MKARRRTSTKLYKERMQPKVFLLRDWGDNDDDGDNDDVLARTMMLRGNRLSPACFVRVAGVFGTVSGSGL